MKNLIIMKVKIITQLVLGILLSLNANAQSEKIKGKLYKIKIERIQGEVAEGYLYDCNSSQVEILTTRYLDSSNILTIPVEHIERIKIRRRGSIGAGVGIGAIAGGAVGYAIGYGSADEDDWLFSRSDQGLFGLIVGVPLGVGAGALIGLKGKRFEINSTMENLKKSCEKIKILGVRSIHGL